MVLWTIMMELNIKSQRYWQSRTSDNIPDGVMEMQIVDVINTNL